MQPSTIQIYVSETTISNVSCQVVYSKYSIYDVLYMGFYATCSVFFGRELVVLQVFSQNAVMFTTD